MTKKEAAKDPQGKKWLITINNPEDKGFTRERIKLELQSLKSLVYCCIADEIGEQGTAHVHVFCAFSSNIRFTTLQNCFDSQAHLERSIGSCHANRDYVGKFGKWVDTDKVETTIENSFEEWGEIPTERFGGQISIEAMIMERVLDGATNAEILIAFPHYLRGIRDVEYVRQTLRAEEYRNKWRDLETVYIWGATGAGKTRSVMDKYGYSNVYAVNNYKYPFDAYSGEDVLLLDEFNSNIRIQDMNNYLDGYPLNLPARYSNKVATYNHVAIISNLDLREQYIHEQNAQPEVWRALLRRIHKVIHFTADGTQNEYSTQEYLAQNV